MICCHPSETRRRVGRPSAATSAATEVARVSVRKDATTTSNRPLPTVVATVDGRGAGACRGMVIPEFAATSGAAAVTRAAAGSGRMLDAPVEGEPGATDGGACAAGGWVARTPNQIAPTN